MKKKYNRVIVIFYRGLVNSYGGLSFNVLKGPDIHAARTRIKIYDHSNYVPFFIFIFYFYALF